MSSRSLLIHASSVFKAVKLVAGQFVELSGSSLEVQRAVMDRECRKWVFSREHV